MRAAIRETDASVEKWIRRNPVTLRLNFLLVYFKEFALFKDCRGLKQLSTVRVTGRGGTTAVWVHPQLCGVLPRLMSEALARGVVGS